MMASCPDWTPSEVKYQVIFEGGFGDARCVLTIQEEHDGKAQTVFQKLLRSHIEEIKLAGRVIKERSTPSLRSYKRLSRTSRYKNPVLKREDINVEGQRKWVRFGIYPKDAVQSRLVMDVIRLPTQRLQVVLSKGSDDESQRWWFERGMIRNKAYPGKVLAVDQDGKNRPKNKLGDLHLVEENRMAINQRWIYFIKEEVFESGVPGRYVIDCWHDTKKIKEGVTVIAHNDCGKREQKVIIKDNPLNTFRETPAEILARGPAAKEAFEKASQDGTTPVYRTRLMLVGQERVGKTSLMKNITGQKFNSAESFTEGVDTSTRCAVTGNSNEPWKIQLIEKTDFAEHVQSQYDDTMCDLIVQRLTELGQEIKGLQDNEHISARGSEQSIGIVDEQLVETRMIDSLLSNKKDAEPSIGKIDDTPTLSEDNEHGGKPEAFIERVLSEKILERLRKTKSENDPEDKESTVQEFQIWDFAGQDVYYTTHQVFLSSRAIYIVTFDLCHDLTKPEKIQISSAGKVQTRFHELTGHEFLDFWMQSIYAYTTTSQRQPEKKTPQLSPPIFIVGTHRESLAIRKDPNERKQLIEAKFQSIRKMIADKPYEKHVVSKFYAIENSSTDKDDYELSQLREHIVSVANDEPYMGEKIPLRWLQFEKSLVEAINEDQQYMDLEQIKDIAKVLDIKSDTELFTMLHFYHDLGTIIYFGGDDSTNDNLQDMVILDTQWLIDIFKRIITVLPDQEQWPTLKDKWRRLKEEGILEDCLIDHMWHDLLPQKPVLLALMEMFDLLCLRKHADEEGLEGKTYYVPACLQPCSEEDAQLQMAGERKQTIFYIYFHEFLPDGLFNRLIVHAARWSQLQSGEEPKLFYRYGDFCFNNEHSFELQMLTTKPLCIKVTISIMPVFSLGEPEEKDNCLIQPSHLVCDSVKTFLAKTLLELTTTWVYGIRYTFSVACPACNTMPHVSRCLHLLPLEECRTQTMITCTKRKVQIKTEEFKMWFQVIAAGDSSDTSLKQLSDKDIRLITHNAGLLKADLDNLLQELKISSVDQENGRRTADTLDFQLQANKILRDWRQHKGKDATRNTVIKALNECKLIAAKELIEKQWGFATA